MYRKNQLFFSIVLVLLLLVLSMPESYGRKKFKALLFRRFEIYSNPKYVDNFYGNISADRAALNLAMTQITSVPVDYWMGVGISFRPRAAKKYRSIVSFNVNVCNLLRNELNQQSLIHIWMNNLLKYSNMPRSCPWKVGSYYWRELRPEERSVPQFLSAGVYRIDSKFYLKELNNALFANVTLYFEIQTN